MFYKTNTNVGAEKVAQKSADNSDFGTEWTLEDISEGTIVAMDDDYVVIEDAQKNIFEHPENGLSDAEIEELVEQNDRAVEAEFGYMEAWGDLIILPREN
ncbi:hypothetical protein [Haloferax larsenii]|uniref:Uncharacterized protein n=1 Tax=Haloferax larsenii TaxID=302484 RepID=A0A1H7QS89_HALLR|nr:hypothetical protein [Haloferax larsenii]SEL50495.1 hypothetical protein SAMN04488691_105128 [Haloferax larsenii]